MPPKGRKQYQPGEEVMQVDDPKNPAFKAQPIKNSRKRSKTVHPSIENAPIEIDSDDEQSRPSKKSRSGPTASKLNNRAAKQKEPLFEARQESEESDSLEVIPCPNLPLRALLHPFADEDADVYVSLTQKNPKYVLRMHSHVLKRASPWFFNQLQERHMDELDQGVAAKVTEDTGIKYRFELELDDKLQYHVLKRVGLTMLKKEPQALSTRSAYEFSSTGQSFLSSSASFASRSSSFIHQYDGSFDDVEMGNTMGYLDAAPSFDEPDPISLTGSLHLSQSLINEDQGKENHIKLEEDTTFPLNAAGLDSPTQKATTDQVATPPTSPSKTETENETEQTLPQSPQIITGSQVVLADQSAAIYDMSIKTEVDPEEQIFSQKLLNTKAPERQLEVFNAAGKVNENHHSVMQASPVQIVRQVSPEEQLQMTISIENSIEEENKIERAQQVAALPLEQQLKFNPIVEEPSINHASNQLVIFTQEKSNNDKPNQKPTERLGKSVGMLDAMHSLFLCFYGCNPGISTTDMAVAMKQATVLVKLATVYNSLKIVRPHIIVSLLSHGRNLYSAIRDDPPRFLVQAYKLKCTPIFKEALIHIVGQYPSWPWPTPQSQLGLNLGQIIDKKFDDLQHMRFKVNGPLFQSCIVKDKVRVSINNLDRSTFDIWVIVQIWHDWLSQQLRHCTLVQRHKHRNVEKNMYRLIAQGGDAYLKIDDVMAMIEPFRAGSETREWGHWKKDQVELQLRILKEHAAMKVVDLLDNELMGDTGGKAGEIEYLTCTKVDEHELPWVEAPLVIIED
ncbi:hypothetical protein BOTCAL_0518g00050 [Botryotinia calthae]|uniref:BTB domain-containing protein n=1 Tax=Botryotinia calthae TaxID=38488 RepID=A0A4Y8CKW5_9HELO|nr:hypothetical protein BOTCAL_0518g00050 [Botryotinia calthae]